MSVYDVECKILLDANSEREAREKINKLMNNFIVRFILDCELFIDSIVKNYNFENMNELRDNLQ